MKKKSFGDLLIAPHFDQPISESIFEKWSDNLVVNFDPSGYELTELELHYAKANGVDDSLLGAALGHKAIARPWMTESKIPNTYIDHSFRLIRCGFAGEAYSQLEQWVDSYPMLTKLLCINPKMGLDISIEYLNRNWREYFELVHLEKDCRKSNEFLIWKDRVEGVLCKPQGEYDWEAAIENSRRIDSIYKNLLTADQVSDLKARYFGFNCTYDTLNPII